jgi:hypothetical protein
MSSDDLVKLLRLARAGGGDEGWLRLKFVQLGDENMELAWLRQAIGARRLQAARSARCAIDLRRQGVSAAAIAERLGLSRARVYQLLDTDAVGWGDELLQQEADASKSA